MELDYYDGTKEVEVPIEDLRPVLPVFVPPARPLEVGRRPKRLVKQHETALEAFIYMLRSHISHLFHHFSFFFWLGHGAR